MYKRIEPLLDNSVCEARIVDGKVMSYRIRALDGYKLHEISLDEIVFDDETGMETGEIKKGYTKSYLTAGANYDFVKNDREIYCVKES